MERTDDKNGFGVGVRVEGKMGDHLCKQVINP